MSQSNTRKVNIVYLPHRRLEFSSSLLNILSRADKSKFHLSIMIYGERIDQFKLMLETAQSYGISASIEVACHTNIKNYLHKTVHATNMPYEYSIKLDEDIFLSHHVFNFLFTKGCEFLDDSQNLFVTPALSNGIPSIQNFMDSYLMDDEKRALVDVFSKSKIPKRLWGVNWENEQHVLDGGYNHDSWFNTVARNPHYYKGLHPVRYDWDSQLMMNEFVKKYIGMFNDPVDFTIDEITRPYFCNSVFLIKTSEWKSIINDKSLFVDDFEEVPLNRYWKNTQKKALCLTNSFGIHTMYNTLEDVPKRDAAEHAFYRSIKDSL